MVIDLAILSKILYGKRKLKGEGYDQYEEPKSPGCLSQPAQKG